jgi:hypothetical protein
VYKYKYFVVYNYKYFIVYNTLDKCRNFKNMVYTIKYTSVISNKYSGCVLAKIWCYYSHQKKYTWDSTSKCYLCVCVSVVDLTTRSNSRTLASTNRTTVINELEGIWKQTVSPLALLSMQDPGLFQDQFPSVSSLSYFSPASNTHFLYIIFNVILPSFSWLSNRLFSFRSILKHLHISSSWRSFHVFPTILNLPFLASEIRK